MMGIARSSADDPAIFASPVGTSPPTARLLRAVAKDAATELKNAPVPEIFAVASRWRKD
jgi:hypothetical protein